MIKLEKNPLLRAAPHREGRGAGHRRRAPPQGHHRLESRSRGAGSVMAPYVEGISALVHLRPQLHRVHLRRRSIHRHLQPLSRPLTRALAEVLKTGNARISECEPRRAGVPPPRSWRTPQGSRAIGVRRTQPSVRAPASARFWRCSPLSASRSSRFGRHCRRRRAGRGGAVCGRGPELAVRAEHDRARPDFIRVVELLPRAFGRGGVVVSLHGQSHRYHLRDTRAVSFGPRLPVLLIAFGRIVRHRLREVPHLRDTRPRSFGASSHGPYHLAALGRSCRHRRRGPAGHPAPGNSAASNWPPKPASLFSLR